MMTHNKSIVANATHHLNQLREFADGTLFDVTLRSWPSRDGRMLAALAMSPDVAHTVAMFMMDYMPIDDVKRLMFSAIADGCGGQAILYWLDLEVPEDFRDSDDDGSLDDFDFDGDE